MSSPFASEAEYSAAVGSIFKKLLKSIDALDPDKVEADSTGDMLTVTHPASGEKVIVNTQRAVHQIWVAGKSQGIHFSWSPGKSQWLDDKGKGLELMAWVAECVRSATGEAVSFS